MIKNIGSLSHCGVGLPTALKRTPFPLLTNHCLWVILLLAGSVFRPEMAIAQDGAATGIPHKIAQCERAGTAPQKCSTWTWNGNQFEGRWSDGAVGQMTVERFDADGVVITRVDQTGASAGLTATYIGKLNGNVIQGTAVWVLNGKSVRGTWAGSLPANYGSGPRPGRTTEAASAAPLRTAAQAPSKTSTANPVTMTECEGTNNCATWTFLGAQGNGQWPSGEVANLSVERYDDNSVVIRRADSTGSSAGLTAVYTGTRHGDRVGGEFTSSWPGHWESKLGNWYATVEKAAQSPPAVMRICDPRGNCSTWTWNKEHYDGLFDGSPLTAKITVVSFSLGSVILKRTDLGFRSGYAYVYTGKISSEGNRILSGDWLGEAGSAQAGLSGHFTATWGTALRDTPAQPQRPIVVVRPGPVCFAWFFTLICE